MNIDKECLKAIKLLKERGVLCSEGDCLGESYSGGMCSKHQARLRRNGSAAISKNPNWGKRASIADKRTYQIWWNMVKRCHNSEHKFYRHYGGRGISVCDRWRDSFDNFIEDMGDRPLSSGRRGMSLDRINNNGNYEPGNCRWATWAEQARNRRNTRLNIGKARLMRSLYGHGMSCPEIARETGIPYSYVFSVIKEGTWKDANLS